MSKRIATPTQKLYAGDTDRIVSVDCRGLLDDGETVSAVSIENSGGLTADQAQVLTSEQTIEGETVGANLAVAFRVDRGSAAAGRYEIDLLITSSSGQVIPGSVAIRCV
ncbi:MAG: hypothetical protein AAGI72_15470 [Pseudomonadota bacterium]